MITNNLNIDVNELRELYTEKVVQDNYQSVCYFAKCIWCKSDARHQR